MTQQGKVIKVTGDKATVFVNRKSACDSCSGKTSCEGNAFSSCTRTSSVEVTARNGINANVGDIVEVETPTRLILLLTFSVFILPLLVGISAFYIAEMIFDIQLYSYIFSFIFFLLSVAVLYFSLNSYMSKRVSVSVIKIIKKGQITDYSGEC